MKTEDVALYDPTSTKADKFGNHVSNFEVFCTLYAQQPKFSAARIPEVGTRFKSERPYFFHKPSANERVPVGTELEVRGYGVEHGFFYALCSLVTKPNDPRQLWVAGCDVAAWRTGT